MTCIKISSLDKGCNTSWLCLFENVFKIHRWLLCKWCSLLPFQHDLGRYYSSSRWISVRQEENKTSMSTLWQRDISLGSSDEGTAIALTQWLFLKPFCFGCEDDVVCLCDSVSCSWTRPSNCLISLSYSTHSGTILAAAVSFGSFVFGLLHCKKHRQNISVQQGSQHCLWCAFVPNLISNSVKRTLQHVLCLNYKVVF